MLKNKQIIIPPDFFQLLHSKHLLLDTSFFGDYSAHPEIFIDFVQTCRSNSVTFVTNVPVATEFTRGSDTPQIFKDKTNLIETVVGQYLLPISPKVQKELPWLAEKYGQIGKAVSMTDFVLAAQTKVHAYDLCLITKNPKDFPRSIFPVKTYFLLQLERELQVYAILFYQNQSKSLKSDIPF